MAVSRYYSSVARRTTLTGDITSSATTMTVAAATGFPSTYPYTLIIDQDTVSEEIVEVTGRSSTTLTITRGVDGTSGVAHTAGAAVEHGVSARDFSESRQHEDASEAVHGLGSGSAVVGTTDAQTLTNKTLTSPTVNGATVTGTVSGGTLSGQTVTSATLGSDLAAGGYRVTGLADPSSAQDAATKNFVEAGVTSQVVIATTQATNAAASAAAASSSATSSASSASASASSAASSSAAQTAAEAAQTASEAAQSAAETAETNAAASAVEAEDWANKTTGTVDGVEYSAKYYSQASSSSASSSASSASAAAGSASAAASSASSASTAQAAAEAAQAAAELAQSGAETAETSAAASAASVDATATTAVEFRQFAADGSLLANLPARVHPAEQLLKQAVWWIDAAHSSASGQSVSNLGWGGSALDAQLGSSGSADSNDPKYLDWQGENYVYLPGVYGNYLSVPDEAALDITGDIDIRVRVALDDWTPGSDQVLLSKFTGGGGQSFLLWIQGASTGTVQWIWSANGTSNTTISSTLPNGVTDGSVKWIRVTHDVDNGASGNDVRFFTSDDGATWVQLGTTITTAGIASFHVSTTPVEIGTRNGGVLSANAAKIYGAQVLDGIDGTPVLDVDCSQIASGADTSFTALTGQTVTINRSTSGRKTVGVVHPRWLFGTDDYMEVPDNDLIDFGASDSFTVLAVMRVFGSSSYTGAYKAAGQTGTSAGWVEYNAGVRLRDGTNSVSVTGPTPTDGAAFCKAMVVDRLTDTMYAYVDTASVSGDISTVGDSSNGNVLRIGGTGNTSDNEFTAAAVWRRALTAGELATLTSYFQGREGA